jgi:primosomal protein N' (replication factor Y)
MQQKRVYESVPDAPPPTTAMGSRLWQALQAEPLSFHQVVARFGTDAVLELERLIHAGAVREKVAHKDRVAARTEPVLRAVVDEERLREAYRERQGRAPRQAQLLAELLRSDEVALRDLGLQPSIPALRALVADGLAVVAHREVYRTVQSGPQFHDAAVEALTPWQERAVKALVSALDSGSFAEYVMHGVTGSGKTEVYLRVMERCLAEGGGAIVLVPEISLTPQMVSRFTSRFGALVAVLHSGLSTGEKRDEWMRIRRGEARVAIGARSAVLAPVQNLRLLIVDEEHEPSYKQDETPRYDARDVARWRMERAAGTLIFGSATPSLQAMRQVEVGRAQLVVLPQRANGRPLPPVDVVDMRQELKAGNRSLFSRALQEGLETAIAEGHQAILFLNRRGYAPFLICRNCGEVPECPNCDIALTMHRGKSGEWLRCHYCGFTEELNAVCSKCNEAALRPYGVGTQQVEEALRQLHPEWRLLRMDVDTTRRKGAHQQIVGQFLAGEADVLIGTQMVAKGLDFPNVTFVGVISADTMLAVPDYRAAERTFQLLTQVAGRAGRAVVPGRTVVQTYRPEHYAIQAAAHHDYRSFYDCERQLRETFVYPPFCELAVFTAVHPERRLAESAARRFERELRRGLGDEAARVLPAVPAGVERIEGKYRFQVVVKYFQWSDVESVIRAAYELVAQKMKPLDGSCILDVNAARV